MRSEAIEKFTRSLGETAGSRFNAAKRLASHDRRLTELTSFSSVYVIILTVLPYFISLPSGVINYLALFTIALSIIILITSLLQYSSNNSANSEQLHRSGLEINELKREIEIRKDKIDLDDLDFLRVRYDNILQKYSINHDDKDYALYQIGNREKYPFIGNFSAFITSSEITLQKYMLRIFLLFISAVILFLVLFLLYSYPARPS